MSRCLVDVDVEVKATARQLAADLDYSLLTPLQKEVVVQFATGHDVFAVLPIAATPVAASNCISPEQTRVLECYQTLPLYAKGRQRQTSAFQLGSANDHLFLHPSVKYRPCCIIGTPLCMSRFNRCRIKQILQTTCISYCS